MDSPGKDKHTGPNAYRDCKVFTEGLPKHRCYHQSCNIEVKNADKLLKERFGFQANQKHDILTIESGIILRNWTISTQRMMKGMSS